ncbi:MAG: hypothetical protein ABIK09_10105 [Pseudomonadota bacterium]
MVEIRLRASVSIGAGPLAGQRSVAAIHAPLGPDLALLAVFAPVPHLPGSDWAVGIAEQALLEEAAAGEGPRSVDPGRWLDEALRRVEERVLQAGRGRPSLDGETGAASLVALVAGQTLYLHHLGHARPYLMREGTLMPLAREHTKVREPISGHNEGRKHRNVGLEVTRWLGMAAPGDGPAASAFPIPLQIGDRVLLVSDGLYNTITDGNIADIAAGPWSGEGIAQRLVDATRFRWTGGEQAAVCVLELVSPGEGQAEEPSQGTGASERDEITFRDLAEAAASAESGDERSGKPGEPFVPPPEELVPATTSTPPDSTDEPAREISGTSEFEDVEEGPQDKGPSRRTIVIFAALVLALIASVVLLWFPFWEETPDRGGRLEAPGKDAVHRPATSVISSSEEPGPVAAMDTAAPAVSVTGSSEVSSPEPIPAVPGSAGAPTPNEDPCVACAGTVDAQRAIATRDPCTAMTALDQPEAAEVCRRCNERGERADLAGVQRTWQLECRDLRFMKEQNAQGVRRCRAKIKSVEEHRRGNRCAAARAGVESLTRGPCADNPEVAGRIRSLADEIDRWCHADPPPQDPRDRPAEPFTVKIGDFIVPLPVMPGD